ncbi:MAG: GTP-binding protein [Candidatus Lokiarchaeota archaeon]|nr:GTP-binding protein [Candidatus Lokiarchaeota archaeon]
MNQKKIFLKGVVLGDGGVGKTSLIIRHVDKAFGSDYKPTLGFDISLKTIILEEFQAELLIWDIGGQAIFKEIRESYLEGSHCCMLVYDITNEESFKNLENWLGELTKFSGDVPFILVGNKIDLGKNREVPKDKGEEKAKELGAVKFYEASAKSGIEVDKAFEDLTKASIDFFKKRTK